MASIYLSASIGIASSAAGMSAHTLILEADTAMYLAKTSGRNRITTADRVPEKSELVTALVDRSGRAHFFL